MGCHTDMMLKIFLVSALIFSVDGLCCTDEDCPPDSTCMAGECSGPRDAPGRVRRDSEDGSCSSSSLEWECPPGFYCLSEVGEEKGFCVEDSWLEGSYEDGDEIEVELRDDDVLESVHDAAPIGRIRRDSDGRILLF